MTIQIGSKTAARRRGDGNAVYARVAADIRQSVQKSGLGAGSMLPSLRQLAVEYKVSIATVQQAVGMLVADGTLVAKAGQGLYIAEPVAGHGGLQAPTILRDPGFDHGEIARPASAKVTRQLTIGLVSPLYGGPVNTPEENAILILLRSTEGPLSESGVSTVHRALSTVRPTRPEHVSDCVSRLINDRVDAIAMLFVDHITFIQAAMKLTEEANIPLVVVSSLQRRAPVPRVYYDGRDAGAQAARHLIRQGCRNLMYFSPFNANWVIERMEGAYDAIRLAGLHDDILDVQISSRETESVTVPTNTTFYDNAFDHAQKVFSEVPVPDGIIASNDESALGLMKALESRGYEAGRDYLIIGFDDKPEGRAHGLSSLRPPLEGLGHTAARLLIDVVHHGSSNQAISLHSHLVIRKSTHRKILSEVS